MSEWKKVKLGNICERVTSGGTPKANVSSYYYPPIIPWLKTKEVNYCRITETENFISEEGLNNSSAKLIAPNSVIVAMYGQGDTAGRVAINKIPLTTNQACCNLTIDESKADYEFIYYQLCTLYNKMVSLKAGAAQPNLNAQIIKNLEVKLPSLLIQHRIATILSRYDSLIENYQKQIKLLEEAAQRLYKEWFVDLHFPDHENTKIINGVPEGWEKRKIEELVNIKSGYAFKSKDWQSKGHPVVKIKDINGTFVLSDSLDCVPITAAKKANQFILRTGDLVIAMTGATIGKVGIVTEDNIYTNQRVGKFFVKDRFILPFLYCYFKQKSTIDLVLKISSSSAAQPNISGSQLGSFVFMYNKELLDKYCDKVQYLFQKIIMLQKQARLLTEARDRLLQKLMSGEIEMKV